MNGLWFVIGLLVTGGVGYLVGRVVETLRRERRAIEAFDFAHHNFSRDLSDLYDGLQVERRNRGE